MKNKNQPVENEIERCCAKSCKGKATRFSFCEEHFEHFKFGLIKKDGSAVSDYEKKYAQYQDHRERSIRKVA